MRWRRQPVRQQVPAPLLPWLTWPDSLTAALQAAGSGFRVKVVAGGLVPSCLSALRLPCQQREVILELAGQPVIFAHSELSTVARGSLTRWLARLGSRSLGSLLFTHPGFRRSPIEYCRLTPGDALYQRAAAFVTLDGPIWARRSVHAFGQQQVSVTELFLTPLADFQVPTKKRVALVLR